MNSKFSDFFRLATYEEKERVWKEIARKSCEDQQEIINKAKQMSALNEKIVATCKECEKAKKIANSSKEWTIMCPKCALKVMMEKLTNKNHGKH